MPWFQEVHSNMTKWNKPPDIPLMRKCIQESGVGVTMFARYYGIPRATLAKSLSTAPKTTRQLPAQYWHFFYEYGQHGPCKKELEKKEKKPPRKKPLTDPALLLLTQP